MQRLAALTKGEHGHYDMTKFTCIIDHILRKYRSTTRQSSVVSLLEAETVLGGITYGGATLTST